MIGKKFLSVINEGSKENLKEFKFFFKSSNESRKKLCLEILSALIQDGIQYYEDVTMKKLLAKHGNGQLRNAFSVLTKSYKKYICQKHLEKNEDLVNYILSCNARETKNKNILELISKGKDKQAENRASVESVFSYEIYKDLNFDKEDLNSLIQQYRSLDKYILLEKVKLFLSIFTEANINSSDIPVFIKLEYLNIIVNNKSPRINPGLEGLILALDLTVNRNEDNLTQLNNDREKFIKNLDEEGIGLMFASCFNFYTSKINEGHSEYNEIYLELIEERLKHENVRLKEKEFKNFILMLCRHNKVEFAEAILNERIYDFKESERSNISNFNMSTIYSYKNEHDKAIESLSAVQLSNTSLYLSSKFRLMKIYYDLDNHENLRSIIENLRVFMSTTSDLSAKNRDSIRLFVNTMSKLSKIRTLIDKNDQKEQGQKLFEKINSTPHLMTKKWFVSELEFIISN